MKRIAINDWLLTESVRHHEEHAGRRPDDTAALAVARGVDGGLSQRLVARARALPGADAVRADIRQLRRRGYQMTLVLMGLAAIAGMIAARASVAERQVDVLLAAGTLLLLPSVMLLIWAVVMLAGRRRRASGSAIGSLAAAGLRRLAPGMLDSKRAGEVALAAAGLLTTVPGRWLLSAVSHLFWIVYGAAALITLVVFFSVAQYELTWGTTLLADDTVVGAMRALGALPAQLGLIPAPEADWILAGQAGSESAADRALWARFVLALVVVYGIAPRVVLLALSALRLAQAAGRLRLDTRLPGYLRLQAELADAEPDPAEHGEPPDPEPVREPRRRRPDSSERVLLAGVELECESDQWPPALPGVTFEDLGRADTREHRARLESAVDGLDRPPAALLAVCSLLRTPDAGTGRFLDRLAGRADAPLVLVLAEGERLAQRDIDARSRRADWQVLAGRIGAETVVIDLASPAADALARLRELTGPGHES